MGRLRALAPALLAATLAGPAPAEQLVVVELYTSQGCSSCPPADEFLTELAQREDVLPLALHVDYWDYIGWHDSFGQEAFTHRQKSYARAFRERMIYTPQIIVDGVAHTVGNRPMEVMDLIHRQWDKEAGAEISLHRTGDALEVGVRAHEEGPFVVQLVRYRPGEQVEITAGENAGRTMHYSNIVTEWISLGEWDGRAPFEAHLNVDGVEPLAVLVQRLGPGEIVAAAALD